MTMRVRAVVQAPLRFARRLSRWQLAFLLPCVGLALALLLHVAQWVTSWISTSVAQSRGAAETCSDLIDDFGADPDAVELVDRAPFGFTCFASTHDGYSMIEYSGVTSAMFVLSAGLAALGFAVLLGVLLAFSVTRLVTLYRSPFSEPRRVRWATRLIGAGGFLLPLMLLGQYLQWYSASKSGGFGICPESVGSDDVLGFSVTAGYLPPSLTCSGDTVGGQQFSVTQYGFPFYGFLAGLILVAVGLVLLFVVKPLLTRRTRAVPALQRRR
ncbi:MAG: hypothetical protein ACTIC1_02500 [Brevibacterium sp.]